MALAYSTNLVDLYHGKAEEILPSFTTESFDLILTDPPYGVKSQSGFRKETQDEIHNDGPEDRGLIHEVLRECVRLVGQNRHLYIFGPSDVVEGLKVSATATLIWDRCVVGAGDLTIPWGPSYEPITFAISKHRHAGQTGKDSPAVRLRKQSVIRAMRPTGRKVIHPHEKPIFLLRELIESSTTQGNRVLDPFAGSGSTGVAALLAGRKATLIESDERWIEHAIDRLASTEEALNRLESA